MPVAARDPSARRPFAGHTVAARSASVETRLLPTDESEDAYGNDQHAAPVPDPAALMGQVRARTHEAALNIRDQHTVSQALLRRFTRSVPGNAGSS
jgi:hypothetical protein